MVLDKYVEDKGLKRILRSVVIVALVPTLWVVCVYKIPGAELCPTFVRSTLR